MHPAFVCVLFFVGIVFVIKGGDFFVDAASWIAKASGIPPFIIGATIISLATSLPEIIVSVLAATEGKVDMAIGNGIGSVNANTGLILAIAIIFMPITIKRKEYLFQCCLLIASAGIILLASFSGVFQLWGNILLVILFLLYIFDNVKAAKRTRTNTETIQYTNRDILKNTGKFLIGSLGIITGSQLLVQNGSSLALFLGVSEQIIAVTLLAVGTSLPELVTTVSAIVKKEAHLSVGNLIGANIIDLSLILLLSTFATGKNLSVSSQSVFFDIPVCLFLILFALIPLLIRQKAAKWQGVLLLLCYVAYVFVVIKMG